MDIQKTIDFVKNMILIHEKAINLAKSELSDIDTIYTAGGNTDETIEKFAKNIIYSYTQNISVMTQWLKDNDRKEEVNKLWALK